MIWVAAATDIKFGGNRQKQIYSLCTLSRPFIDWLVDQEETEKSFYSAQWDSPRNRRATAIDGFKL